MISRAIDKDSVMSDEDRFIAIESKIAYQEDLAQTLGDTVIQQQHRISVLEQRVRGLLERLSALGLQSTADAGYDEQPPHY